MFLRGEAAWAARVRHRIPGAGGLRTFSVVFLPGRGKDRVYACDGGALRGRRFFRDEGEQETVEAGAQGDRQEIYAGGKGVWLPDDHAAHACAAQDVDRGESGDGRAVSGGEEEDIQDGRARMSAAG